MVVLTASTGELFEVDPWNQLARLQTTLSSNPDEAITDVNFLGADPGEVLAMLYRNLFSDDFERHIYVVMGRDDCVHIFTENGDRINEPENFVVDGVQKLTGEDSFMYEWGGDGGDYYELALTEPSPSHSPSPIRSRSPSIAGSPVSEIEDGEAEAVGDGGGGEDGG